MNPICSFRSGNGSIEICREGSSMMDMNDAEFNAFLTLVLFVQGRKNPLPQTKPQTENMKRNLTFGDALAALKQGKRIAREGWNGKAMFLSGWLASQTDMLCEDWTILDDDHDAAPAKQAVS